LKSGSLNNMEPPGSVQACTGIALLIAFVGLLYIRTSRYIACKLGWQFCSYPVTT